MTPGAVASLPRLVRNLVGGVASWLVPLAVALVATPIVVHGVGVETYGVYAVALGYANAVGSLNVAQGLVRELAAVPSGDAEARGSLASSALLLAALVGAAGTLVLLLLARPYAAATFESPALAPLGLAALSLASASVPLTILSLAARAVPQGLQRFDLAALFTTAGGLVLSVGNALLARGGRGILALLTWNLAVNGLLLLAALALIRPLLGQPLRAPSWSRIAGLARFGALTTSCQAFTALSFLFERTLIARCLGPGAVALFVLPLSIGAYLHAGVGSATLLLMPLASELDASDQRARLKAAYFGATKVVALIVVVATAVLLAASRSLLELWLGPVFAEQAPVLRVLAVAFALNTLAILPWHFSEGLNRPARNAGISLLWALTGALLLALLVGPLGLRGAAWARVGAMLSVPVYVALFERSVLGATFGRAWLRIGAYLLPAGAAVWAVLAAAFGRLPPSWPLLIGASGAAFGLCLALLWRTRYFDEAERRRLAASLRIALGSGPARSLPVAGDVS